MVVLNAFRNHLRDFIVSGTGSNAFNYVAFGSGSTTPTVEDTTLTTEIDRVSADSIGAVAMGQVKIVATILSTDTDFDDETIREWGAVNNSTGGTFIQHQLQIAHTLDDERTYDLKYEITVKVV